MKPLPGTPSWLGVTNAQTALSLILEHGDLTRNEIGELTGLSRPTAAQIVGRLESAGLIHPVGERSGGRGPSAVTYGIRPGQTLGIAIAWQTQVTRAQLVDIAGSTYPVMEWLRGARARPADVVAELAGIIAETCGTSGCADASIGIVVIGVPSEISPTSGELSFSGDMPGWPSGNVAKSLSAALGRTVVIWNDVKVSAVAERRLGSGQHLGSFALCWVGEGLGVAIDVHGEVLSGNSGGAGEIGYLSIPVGAAMLDGAAKDLQDLVSGRAISTIADDFGLGASDFESLLAKIEHSPQRNDILVRFAARIAIGIEPVLAVLDPEAVILGGPVGVIGGGFLAGAVQRALEHTTRWRTRIEGTRVGQLPVLTGAGCVLHDLLREELFAAVG